MQNINIYNLCVGGIWCLETRLPFLLSFFLKFHSGRVGKGAGGCGVGSLLYPCFPLSPPTPFPFLSPSFCFVFLLFGPARFCFFYSPRILSFGFIFPFPPNSFPFFLLPPPSFPHFRPPPALPFLSIHPPPLTHSLALHAFLSLLSPDLSFVHLPFPSRFPFFRFRSLPAPNLFHSRSRFPCFFSPSLPLFTSICFIFYFNCIPFTRFFIIHFLFPTVLYLTSLFPRPHLRRTFRCLPLPPSVLSRTPDRWSRFPSIAPFFSRFLYFFVVFLLYIVFVLFTPFNHYFLCSGPYRRVVVRPKAVPGPPETPPPHQIAGSSRGQGVGGWFMLGGGVEDARFI
jgi:hypothetical protein